MFGQRPEGGSGRTFNNNQEGIPSLSAVHIVSEGDGNLRDSISFESFSLLDVHGADGKALARMCPRSNNVRHELSKSAFGDAEKFSVPSIKMEDISDGDKNLASRLRSSSHKSIAVKNRGYSLRPRRHNV